MGRSHTAFKNIFQEGEYKNLCEFSDAQLWTEDGCSFGIHRIILAKENSYFKALFKYAGKNQKRFVVRGITGQSLDQILCFVYTRTAPTDPDNICDLLVASDYLLVDDLKRHLKKYLMENITVDNCVPTYWTSLRINDAALTHFSHRFIQTNFQTLIQHDRLDFEEISLEFLEQFLHDPSLCVTGEHIVWTCIEKWITKDRSDRLPELPRLLECLKVADIDEALANTIVHSDLFSENLLYGSSNGAEMTSRSLDVLKCAIHSPDDHSQTHRLPRRLNVVLQYTMLGATENVKLYVTYDEKIDLWKPLGETETFASDMTVVGHKVYILGSYYNSNNNVIFDLQQREWSEMASPRTERACYATVTLGENIFILGGLDEIADEWITSVEFYNTETGIWFDAAPMQPVDCYSAVSYRNKIFVVGNLFDDSDSYMVAQVYDPELDSWSFFEPPTHYCFEFALVEFRGKLYVIGGADRQVSITVVEVFDFETNSWDSAPDLPYAFTDPKAIVLNDRLIVYDSFPEKFPPVTWCEEEQSWKPLNGPKSFHKHLFYPVEDEVEIQALLRDLRDPAVHLERSPFDV